jgi:hypothetical protein
LYNSWYNYSAIRPATPQGPDFPPEQAGSAYSPSHGAPGLYIVLGYPLIPFANYEFYC